jgi:hypothetical protein
MAEALDVECSDRRGTGNRVECGNEPLDRSHLSWFSLGAQPGHQLPHREAEAVTVLRPPTTGARTLSRISIAVRIARLTDSSQGTLP